MTPNLTPIAPQDALPHRKIIRQWLLPLSGRTTLYAIVLLAFDYGLLLLALSGAVMLESVWLKLLSGCAAGFMTGRLFIIGHDACHQSLTPHRELNKWLGRMAFLPSITPYSLWEMGHNVVHHGYTNLKGFDFVWAPLTREEYAALTPARQRLERLYRSGWAPGLYYMVEIWWKHMFFPAQGEPARRRSAFQWDCLLVSAYGAAWIGAVACAAVQTGQSVTLLLGCAVLVPFMFWCAMIGFVVYVHHTHVRIAWHEDRAAWAKANAFVSTTVHLQFPLRIGALLHHIMEHTAHHVDMSIPLYRLKKAQTMLEDLLPERIVVQDFSWRWYFDTARRCKLYDFRTRTWTDFSGQASTTPSPQLA